MRDGDITFPETFKERWLDRLRHWWHMRKVPTPPPSEPESYDPPFCSVVFEALDDD